MGVQQRDVCPWTKRLLKCANHGPSSPASMEYRRESLNPSPLLPSSDSYSQTISCPTLRKNRAGKIASKLTRSMRGYAACCDCCCQDAIPEGGRGTPAVMCASKAFTSTAPACVFPTPQNRKIWEMKAEPEGDEEQ